MVYAVCKHRVLLLDNSSNGLRLLFSRIGKRVKFQSPQLPERFQNLLPFELNGRQHPVPDLLAHRSVGLLARCLDRFKRRFDAKRLKTFEHLGADRLIDAQRTETDGGVGPIVMRVPQQL